MDKIQDLQDPMTTSLNKIKDPQDPATSFGDKIHNPLDLSAKWQYRIQDPRSWILRIMDLGTCLLPGHLTPPPPKVGIENCLGTCFHKKCTVQLQNYSNFQIILLFELLILPHPNLPEHCLCTAVHAAHDAAQAHHLINEIYHSKYLQNYQPAPNSRVKTINSTAVKTNVHYSAAFEISMVRNKATYRRCKHSRFLRKQVDRICLVIWRVIVIDTMAPIQIHWGPRFPICQL